MIGYVTGTVTNLFSGMVEGQIVMPIGMPLLLDPGYQGYFVKDIQGLGPVKADVSEIPDVSDRGNVYLSARPGGRNIVMRVGFDPGYSENQSITDVRTDLYDVYMPGNKVELYFEHSLYGIVRIDGVVESHEPSIFSKDPEVQISILCDDPYFVDASGALEEYVVPSEAGSQFVVETGLKVPVGFIFQVGVSGTVSLGIQLSARPPRIGDRTLFLNRNFVSGDQVLFNTIRGQRKVTMTRSGSTTNQLGYFSGSLVDSRLYPGQNHFQINNTSTIGNLRFKWYKTYGGL